MPANKNLLLLHGALGSAASFASILPAFESQINTYTLDFEGHGKRAHTDREFRIQNFAENVLNMLNEHQLDAVDVFGYSMGGYVALYLASEMPDRIRSIVTLATKFNWTPESAAREAAMLNPDTMAEKVPAFTEHLERVHSGSGWRDVVHRTRQLLLALGEIPVVTADSLAQITCPVRLMVGDRDKMVGIEETLDAYRALPNGEFAVLPHTPHPLEAVDTEMVAWQVRNFIENRG